MGILWRSESLFSEACAPSFPENAAINSVTLGQIAIRSQYGSFSDVLQDAGVKEKSGTEMQQKARNILGAKYESRECIPWSLVRSSRGSICQYANAVLGIEIPVDCVYGRRRSKIPYHDDIPPPTS